MNTSITISLDTRSNCRKRDGSYPLVLRLSHGSNRTINIPLGYSVHQKDWDKKNRKVRESSKSVTSVKRLNNILSKKKADALDVVIKLDESGLLPSLSIRDLKSRIVNAGNGRVSFFAFTEELIAGMKKAKQFGNARVYKDTMSAIKTYQEGTDLALEEITYDYLKTYETDYLSRGNSINGLAVNMRTIRAIFNKAIRSKLVDRKHYPFVDYQIRSEKTKKRALEKEALMEIVNLDLDHGHPLFHARNYFLISYNMYGMNFIDLAFLKMKHVQRDRIVYKRKKTSRPYDVHMNKSLAALLSFYTKGKKPEDFVFPILNQTELERQYAEVKCRRKQYNKSLSQIATAIGTDAKLTSYVCRHSFATQAVWNDVPLKAIQEMLGHQSLKTTEVYISDLPKKVVDTYSEQLAIG